MSKRFLHSAILLLIAGWLSAQTRFSVEADTNRIMIGEQIRLKIQAEFPENSKINWPFLADTLAGFEVVRKGTMNEEVRDGFKLLSQEVWLTSFDSGYAFIPALRAQVGDEVLASQAIGILVDIPKVDEQGEYYDIKEPLDPPLNWTLIIGSVLVLLALGAIIYWLIGYLRRRRNETPASARAALSPYERAMLQLQELQDEKLWQQGQVKEYYSRVTDVMRMYIEGQMGRPAMESTAYEVTDIIRSLNPRAELMERCEQLMELSVGVKYAKQTPTEADHHAALATLKDFLEAYKPIEQPKDQEHAVSV